jgi:sulfoxide reductase heme-binding subunit YedZ
MPDLPRSITGAAARVPVRLVYGLGLAPAAWTFWLGVNDQLGADPMKVLEHELGEWSLIYLVAGLAVTPLRDLTGVNLIRFRRAIGLLAFAYALLHLLTYGVLDQGLDWAAIWADVVKRPYITVGMAAFVLLLPLAATSNDASIRRLGAAGWRRLHLLVYPAAAGAALHYVLLVKAWPLEPLLYAGAVLGLIVYRGARKISRRTGARGGRARGSAPERGRGPGATVSGQTGAGPNHAEGSRVRVSR